MKRNSKLTTATATALLALLGSAAAYAQDKYSLKSPSGIAFADFKGYEDWAVVSSARTDEVLKVIVANPTMIEAYKAGVPGNGQPFPDGSKIAKLQWKPKKSTEAPFVVDVPDIFTQAFLIEKDSKRYPKSGGWGYALFNYERGIRQVHGRSHQPLGLRTRVPYGREVERLHLPPLPEALTPGGDGMHEVINHDRRRFLGTVAMTITTAQLTTTTARAQTTGSKLAQLPSVKPGTNVSFASLKQIDAGLLNVGYAEAGPIGGRPVVLLHGWPYDIHTYVDVAPVLASAGYRVVVPYLRGYGTTRFVSGETLRNGEQAALALDVIALMDALQVEKAIVAGCDWGARTADIIAALWPERCKALVSVSGYLIGSQAIGKVPLQPKAELQWWYQYYFATERGRAGYDKFRRDFAKLIWQIASPKWNFDDATFERSAAALDNPDHVSIVIHNYRWRLGLAQGEPKYEALETRLAEAPVITVPAITLEGDANGAPHPEPSSYAGKFSGKYSHRTLSGGIGHNLPQEAPQAFAEAIVEVDSY